MGAEWCCGDQMRQDKAKGLNGKVFKWREESNYIKYCRSAGGSVRPLILSVVVSFRLCFSVH